MSDKYCENLVELMAMHFNLLEERKNKLIDDLWDLDRKIIKLEDAIREEVVRHPELDLDLSYFLSE